MLFFITGMAENDDHMCFGEGWLSISGNVTTGDVCYKRDFSTNLLAYANENRELGSFNDVSLITRDGIVPANRMVLSCYSKYFEKMFKLCSKENLESLVEIQGFDGNTLKLLIDFIYTGIIKINCGNVCRLLSASELLLLGDAKKFCFDFLRSSISIENSVVLCLLADRYMEQHFADGVAMFIEENICEVIESNTFTRLAKENFATVFFSKQHRKHFSEITIYKSVVAWTKFNVAERQESFSDFLHQVDFHKLPLHFFENAVVNERLIEENLECFQMVRDVMVERVEEMRTKGARIVSLGGLGTPAMVAVIYRVTNEPVKLYPLLPIPRTSGCSVVLDDFMYFMGGKTMQRLFQTVVNNVHRIHAKDGGEFQTVAPMNERRHNMGAAIMDGFIFVVGGNDDNGIDLATGEYYNPSFGIWNNISPMKEARSGNAVVACNGFLYSLGGHCCSKFLDRAEKFHFSTDVWADVMPMQTPRCWLASVVLDGVIYAIGGQYGDSPKTRLKTVEKYNAKVNSWSYVADMLQARAACSACVMNGKIYVSGGADQNGAAVKTTECFVPYNNKWKVVGNTYTNDLVHHKVVSV